MQLHARAIPRDVPAPVPSRSWWRDAVMYQVYVRSFADATGDGVGDLRGVRASLGYLADLGVDGIWLNPFYPSPQHDHGYDITDHCAIEPGYGTLEDLDLLIAEAHVRGLKVLLDLVPNHASIEHPLFRAAIAGGRAAPERELFHFRDGRGPDGDEPPNNWRSIFGGSVWSRITEPDGELGQWYPHLFTHFQPDWNWRHPGVRARFEDILRFWLDRGADGFRIDAACGLVKGINLIDVDDPLADERVGEPQNRLAWGQPEVHDVYRSWRAICNDYAQRDGNERILIGEIGGFVATDQLRHYLRADELHEAFLFELLDAPWEAATMIEIIDRELRQADHAAGSVAWVLGNHDRVRMATRYGGGAPGAGEGDRAVGLSRARAAALMLLALPGPVFLYQGDELGLPEVVDLADHHITDPIFRRTNGQRRGRDGCRIPLPWSGTAPPFGFSPPATVVGSWLPQPPSFADYTVEQQRPVSSSTWRLHKRALVIRRALALRATEPLAWLDLGPDVIAFSRGGRFACALNMGDTDIELPEGHELLVASVDVSDGRLAPNAAAWWLMA
jgi:alpha-glucosidase